MVHFFFFTVATTLCVSWPPPWFRSRKFFLGGVEIPASNPQCGELGTTFGPYPLTYLVWVALPGAYAPASMAHQFIGACRPPLHVKAVILEEDDSLINRILCRKLTLLYSVENAAIIRTRPNTCIHTYIHTRRNTPSTAGACFPCQ
jgi:hypothetical protein